MYINLVFNEIVNVNQAPYTPNRYYIEKIVMLATQSVNCIITYLYCKNISNKQFVINNICVLKPIF